jgi:rod shape-determining protein MreC
VGSLFAPLTKSGARVQDALSANEERAKTPDELKLENAELRKELDFARMKEAKHTAIEKQNLELTTQLEFRRRYGFILIPAEVLNRRVSAWYKEARIDKGYLDNVVEESPVIAPVQVQDGATTRWEAALVGKIGRCEDKMATVVLVTDETCRVAATVKGMSSVRGILMGARDTSGTAVPDLRLRFLKSQPILEPGTQIISDGVNKKGIFPYGILLGEIKEFVPRNGAEPLATVRTLVDIDNLRYVFVLQQKEEETAVPAPARPTGTAVVPRVVGDASAGDRPGVSPSSLPPP